MVRLGRTIGTGGDQVVQAVACEPNVLKNKMQQHQKPLIWILIAASICVLGLGIFALRAEATATALGSGSTRLPQFVQAMEGEVELPLSIEGRRVLLDTCEMGLQPRLPLLLRFASNEQRQMVVPFCTDLAQSAVEASRADSYAWAILAMAQMRSGDVASAELSLVRSSLTAPTEAWIARTRFELIQDNYEQLSQDVRGIGDADALVLIDGRLGSVVARRYVADAGFRQRSEALFETQPEQIQRRFLSLVRQQI